MPMYLQIKAFNGNSYPEMEDAVNKFMKRQKLMTENFIDIKFSIAALPRDKKDGEAIFSCIVIYRKESDHE